MSAKAKTNPRESTVIGFYKFDIETGVDASCRLAIGKYISFYQIFYYRYEKHLLYILSKVLVQEPQSLLNSLTCL
jgi:hypothetical protein